MWLVAQCGAVIRAFPEGVAIAESSVGSCPSVLPRAACEPAQVLWCSSVVRFSLHSRHPGSITATLFTLKPLEAPQIHDARPTTHRASHFSMCGEERVIRTARMHGAEIRSLTPLPGWQHEMFHVKHYRTHWNTPAAQPSRGAGWRCAAVRADPSPHPLSGLPLIQCHISTAAATPQEDGAEPCPACEEG